MTTDREELGRAIRMLRAQVAKMRRMPLTDPVDAADQATLVLDAAQKHLDTLPKPSRWRVTGWTPNYISDESLPYADQEIALGIAKTWLKAGYINVSVLEVPA